MTHRPPESPPTCRRSTSRRTPRTGCGGCARARAPQLFTSDLSVNEFLLVREAGFRPVGLVLGSSVYHVASRWPGGAGTWRWTG